MIFSLFKTTGSTWLVRNKSSLLISLVTKRMGQRFWEQLLPELQTFAGEGPLQTEKVRPYPLDPNMVAVIKTPGPPPPLPIPPPHSF
jgi:hypothetical protein